MTNLQPFLVGGLEHGFYDFPYIGNVIIPTNELIFFRGVGQPPTSFGWSIPAKEKLPVTFGFQWKNTCGTALGIRGGSDIHREGRSSCVAHLVLFCFV